MEFIFCVYNYSKKEKKKECHKTMLGGLLLIILSKHNERVPEARTLLTIGIVFYVKKIFNATVATP